MCVCLNVCIHVYVFICYVCMFICMQNSALHKHISLCIYISVKHTNTYVISEKGLTTRGSTIQVTSPIENTNALSHPRDFSIPQAKLYMTVRKDPHPIAPMTNNQPPMRQNFATHFFRIANCSSPLTLSKCPPCLVYNDIRNICDFVKKNIITVSTINAIFIVTLIIIISSCSSVSSSM